jgi:hypothetical protein
MARELCWRLAQPRSPGRSICDLGRVGGKESRGKLGRHSAPVSLRRADERIEWRPHESTQWVDQADGVEMWLPDAIAESSYGVRN